MKRRLLLPTAAAALLALPGCGIGSDDAGGGEDDSDKGVDARLEGDEAIVIGDARDAPRVKFFLTSGESEAAQFEGNGEGAEQIGPTLLYVNGGSDELLQTVEGCLAEL